MKKYVKPEIHFVHNNDDSSGEYIAGLSDAAFLGYLKKIHYFEAKKLYQISSGYIMREIGGEYAIVPVGEEGLITNAVMTPNDSAAFLWKEFMNPSTVEDVVMKGLQSYEGSADMIRSDVYRFVKESLHYRILREVI